MPEAAVAAVLVGGSRRRNQEATQDPQSADWPTGRRNTVPQMATATTKLLPCEAQVHDNKKYLI